MLQFLVGIIAAYPVFYGLDRFARPALDDLFGAPDGEHGNPIGILLHEINQMENRLSTQLRQCVEDIHLAIAGCASEAVLRPRIDNVIATWSSIITQGQMYRLNGETESRALREGYQHVSTDIVSIFNNLQDLIQNTSNVEKTFKLLMHAWRCALSVEALYLERQIEFGPDEPEDDAEEQLKNRYQVYIERLRATLVAAGCIQRIRSNNIEQAIYSYKAILQLNNFELVAFDRVNNNEESLLQFICESYADNDGITSERNFIKLLQFIHHLPNVSQKIIAYSHIIRIYNEFNDRRDFWVNQELTHNTSLEVHPNRHNFVLLAFLNRTIRETTHVTAEQGELFSVLRNRIAGHSWWEEFVLSGNKICLNNPWAACIIDAGDASRIHPYAQTNYASCFSRETEDRINPYLQYKGEIVFDDGVPYVRFYNERNRNYLDGGPDHRSARLARGEANDNHYLQWRITRSPFVRGAWGSLPTFFLKCRGNNEYLAPRTAARQHTSHFEDGIDSLNQERNSCVSNRKASRREFGIFRSPKNAVPIPSVEGSSLGDSSDRGSDTRAQYEHCVNYIDALM